ncbi:glycoside hydrolase family 43 protein, partial [Baudoinia panamericana UAMH 10762]
ALDANFADPSIWYKNGTWYAFATNNAAGILQQSNTSAAYEYGASNVQLATSPDFVNWTLLDARSDPLPVVGDWVTQGLTSSFPRIPRANVWAPAIIQRPTDNKYVLYYSANMNNGTPAGWNHPIPHCIGAAVSRGQDPAGPYDPLDDPLACPILQGGAIDAAGFQNTNGTLYVVYKVDGNNIGNGGLCGNTVNPIVPTPLMLQKMRSDGVTTDGNPVQILDRIAADGPLVEAPALVRSSEGIYFLFYSSGCTRSPSYDVKYATATHVNGPYVRASSPLLRTGSWGLSAPG